MDRDVLIEKLSHYTFYQSIDLGDGISTPGGTVGPKQRQVLRYLEQVDLRGKRVVDLGCANGLFALAAERQGAEEVLAVDHTWRNIESLQDIIVPHLKSKVKPIHENVMDFTADKYGEFDLVIFAGVLYHLRYPFQALRIIKDLVKEGGRLILETGIIEDFNRNALMYCPSPKDSPQRSRGGNSCTYFNEKALLETLEYFGLKVLERAVPIPGWKRLAKKVYRNGWRSYNISNMVLLCERDRALENDDLIRFYESTTS